MKNNESLALSWNRIMLIKYFIDCYATKEGAAKLGIPSTTLESKVRSLKINKHRFKPV